MKLYLNDEQFPVDPQPLNDICKGWKLSVLMKQNHISLALIVYLHPILATVPFQLLSDSLEIETFRKSGGIDRIGTWDLLGGKHTCLFLHKKNWIDSKLHICKVRTARDLIPPGLDVLYLIKISCLSTVLRLLELEEELCEKFPKKLVAHTGLEPGTFR